MTTAYGYLTREDGRYADKNRGVTLSRFETTDDGPHMPLDIDTVLGMADAEGVARAAPDEVFVMPPVSRPGFEVLQPGSGWQGGDAMLMRWWSEVSPDGTMGDPCVATPGNGEEFLTAAIEETTAFIREIRALPLPERRDHH